MLPLHTYTYTPPRVPCVPLLFLFTVAFTMLLLIILIALQRTTPEPTQNKPELNKRATHTHTLYTHVPYRMTKFNTGLIEW